MRVLFLSPVGFLGGAERVLLDVIASLQPVMPAGSSLHLICLSDGPLVDAARAIGIQASVLPMPEQLGKLGESGLGGGGLSKVILASRLLIGLPAGLSYLRELRRVVREADPDIIHSNGVKTHLLSRVLQSKRARVVWHVHDLLGDRALLSKMLRHAAGHVAAAIAISQAVADDLNVVLPQTRVFTVLNAIDTEHFTPGPPDGSMLDRLAEMPPSDVDTVRVGLVATYARWKGQDIFLDAIARLSPSAMRVQFYVIGGSIYKTSGSQFSPQELRSRAEKLGVADRVRFIGFQEDTRDIYRALDIMVHASSKPEPFGRTIVEAMACGRAVIVSRAGGAAELFTDNVDGLAVRPGRADDLAAAMERLIGDAQARKVMGDAARETAVRRFSRARFGSEFLSVYQRVVTG